MRQETQSQRQDEVESDDSDSSTDISMSYGLVHFAGGAGASFRDESLESSNPSLSSHCEDAPPSFSYGTNPPSAASHTQVENTEPRRIFDLRSATWNRSQIQVMASQSRGGPDGTSVPSHHRENRIMESRQVFETEVKEPQHSEETDPKTLLSSTQERDSNELQRQGSDSEDDPKKIGLKVNQAVDVEKQLRDICEGLVCLGNPSDAAENSSDEVQRKTLENNEDSMSSDKSADISMSYGVVHFPGSALPRDESLESTIPSLNSCCEYNPPSYSYITNLPNIASLTNMGKTEPKRPGDLRSATTNGSQIQIMASQSQGGPDGASQPSDYQQHETQVKVPVQSEETHPKTSLSSTHLSNKNKVEIRKHSDSEDDSEKIALEVILAGDTAKQIKNSYEDLAYLDIPLNAAENSLDEVQGKTLRKDFFAIRTNVSNEENDFRNVPLHNDDQVQYNNWAFSSELEHKENKLDSAAKSRLDTEETSDSYSSLQNKEDIQKATKRFEDGGKDGSFQDSKSSLGEIETEADDFISDADPVVDGSLSDQRSSPSEDEEVCLNGDAELNREPQIDMHNEFNSSSLSLNSDESGIDIEEQTTHKAKP